MENIVRWSDIQRRWRWLRAGAQERSLLRAQLTQASAQGDQDLIRHLWAQGVVPDRHGHALVAAIQAWGPSCEVATLLLSLWPTAFDTAPALGLVLGAPTHPQDLMRRLARLLPRRAHAANNAGRALGRGLRAFHAADPAQALAWMRELARARPAILPGLAHSMAQAGDQPLLEHVLAFAHPRFECERRALEGFSTGRYHQRQMAQLDEPTLRRLVDAASPTDAALARIMGSPCDLLVRLIDAKLEGHPPAPGKVRARWLVKALRNESLFFRLAPPPECLDWRDSPELLGRLRKMLEWADEPVLLLAARQLASQWNFGDPKEREMLLDLVLGALPWTAAQSEMERAMKRKRGPEAFGPQHGARLEAQALGEALPAPKRQGARRL